MRSKSEILSDALASFENGARWTRGSLFTDEKGAVSYSSDSLIDFGARNGERFCAYGAIYKTMLSHGEMPTASTHEERRKVCAWVEPMLGHGVVMTNDCAANFQPVKDMFCRGIKRALAEEEAASKKEITE